MARAYDPELDGGQEPVVPDTIEDRVRNACVGDAFNTAFLKFVSECERYDFRIDSITLLDVQKPEVREVAVYFGISIMAKKVFR
jgi:hypothetical protein